jgi:hypothetical protein
MSNLLEKASIITTPTAYNNGELLSVKGGTVADFDFSRGSSATRVNSQGLIEDVSGGNDIPRIDYTNGVGNILLEPQSTNLVEYSEDFSDSYWDKNVTITNSSGVSPTGELNAFEYENSGLFNQDIHRAFTLLANTNYTFTIYIKKINSNSFSLNDKIRIGTYGSGITTTSTLLGDALNSANIGEWVRYELSVLTNSTGGSVTFQLRSDEACAIDIFGAQLEQQPFATSYIPTVGSSVTRLKESLTNSGNADLFGTEGVLYTEFKCINNLPSQFIRVINLNDGSSGDDNSVKLLRSNSVSDRFIVQIEISNTIEVSQVITLSDSTEFNKIAISYKSGDTKFFVNGVSVATKTETFTLPTLNQLDLSSSTGFNNFEGNVKCIAVFKEALTDAELQCLTT